MVYAVCFIFIILFLFLLSKYPEYRRRQKCLEKIPSPPGLPIIGHALELRSGVDVYYKMLKWSRTFGGVFKLNVGPMIQYVVSDPEILEYILTSNTLITKSRFYDFIKPWVGSGLATSTGEEWRMKKKALLPTFHLKILENFVDVFDKNVNTLLRNMEELVKEPGIDIHKYVNLCALDIICETAMGAQINAQNNSDCEYVRSAEFLCKNVIDRSFSFSKQFDFLYRLTNSYREEQKYLRSSHEFTESVIRKRRAELSNSSTNQIDENEDVGIKKKVLLLDKLLQMEIGGKPLSDKEIRDEVETFMFAGHETSATAVSFTLHCLAGHTEIQDKAYHEISQVFNGDKQKTVTYPNLCEMKYLDFVIKEAMRLRSVATMAGRKITEEFQCGGYTFLKGADILLHFHGNHLNPKYFENPETFNPDRWLEDDTNRSPYCYLPFSAGPRNCIGQKFASIEMKTFISKILMNFEVLQANPPEDLILSCDLTTKAINGIQLKLKRRGT